MAHDLDVIRSALVDLLVIVVIVAVPAVLVMAWRVGRRRQLVVAEMVNSTGRSELDETTRGLTQLARQRIDAELRVVSERRELLHNALSSTVRSRADSAEMSKSGPHGRRRRRASTRVQQRLDDQLEQLLTAAREVAPEEAQAAVHFITVLVSRPRGLLVSGILQCRGTAGPRWGVSFDVLRVDTNRSVASQTFWEPIASPLTISAKAGQEQPDSRSDDADMAHERIRELLRPAGRWVAIQLVIQSVFPGGARGREKGLDWLLSGMMYRQSTSIFPGYGDMFRRLALEDLREAATTLDEVPIRLAALADIFDQLAASTQHAAAPGMESQAEIYRRAHKEYARALSAMARSRKVPDAVVRRYRVKEAISWLDSGLPKPRHEAFRWLNEGGPDLTKQLLTKDRYDAACLYALAARADSSRLRREQAARLLMQALHLDADTPDRKYWTQAESDPQLSALPVAELVAALEEALASASPVTRLSGKQLHQIVDQVLPFYREITP